MLNVPFSLSACVCVRVYVCVLQRGECATDLKFASNTYAAKFTPAAIASRSHLLHPYHPLFHPVPPSGPLFGLIVNVGFIGAKNTAAEPLSKCSGGFYHTYTYAVMPSFKFKKAITTG